MDGTLPVLTKIVAIEALHHFPIKFEQNQRTPQPAFSLTKYELTSPNIKDHCSSHYYYVGIKFLNSSRTYIKRG